MKSQLKAVLPRRVSVRLHALVCAFSIVFILALAGCGGGPPDNVKRKATHPVTGTLTLNQKPVAGVRITLYPLNEADRGGSHWTQGFPHAITKEDSTFTVSTYVPGDGAPAGDYLVLASLMEGEGEQAKDVLQDRFANPKTAKQKFQVKEQENKLTITLTK
jgi:hypothetical protein